MYELKNMCDIYFIASSSRINKVTESLENNLKVI